ncbi:MAG: FAD-dependent thymidylate synthase [Candidatus Omnitrophica bacterium]|nr:FAD-dependent thymidylate synthase [Candidatus Omnitrophota bacterium]MDD5771320.1 FAD-dependent thymidylate synthase [Candidatus Omnitrophota bacterium]
MPKAKLNVKLLDLTSEPLALIYSACRQCYSEQFAGDIFEKIKDNKEKQAEFIKKIVASGHESPLEHVKFTFAIEGVSRALTHQLVRHRLASYSQQSQRYVKESDFDYIIPPSIEANPAAKKEFEKAMDSIQKSYTRISGLLAEKGLSGEAANQDARFVLPQASETKIIVTMNCRELLLFFKHRCCSRAQWEIRKLAEKMLADCRRYLPLLFSQAGAKCVSLGFCPEGARFSCGRFPVKKGK